METFRFLVAREDMPGMPGLSRGDVVTRVAVEPVPGGYEYDVWRMVDSGMTAKTRIEHRGEFMSCEVDGETMEEMVAKALEVGDGIARARRD